MQSFRFGILQIIRSFSSEIDLDEDVVYKLNRLINKLIQHLTYQSSLITNQCKLVTILKDHVTLALTLSYPNDLSEKALVFSTLLNQPEYIHQKQVEKVMRKSTSYRLSKDSIYTLTKIIQYILQEIIQGIIYEANRYDSYINLFTYNEAFKDYELKHLLLSLNADKFDIHDF